MTDQTSGSDNGTNAPAKGSPEYNQMMADKYANQGNQPDPNAQTFGKPGRPDWVPEKFWNAEKGEIRLQEAFKSMGELESQFTKQRQQQASTPPTDPLQIPTPSPEPPITQKDVKWDELGQKVAANGDLEDADYATLEKAGVTREVAKGLVEGWKARIELALEKTAEHVGGKDNLGKILKWAETALSPDEINSYNAMLKGPQALAALDVLKDRFDKARPGSGEPDPVAGIPSGGGAGFASKVEMINAMSDPRYKTDPAYRNTVRQKVILSKF